MIRTRGCCRLTAPLIGLLVATSPLAAEVRTIVIGEEGDLTWRGQGTAPVEAILPALTRSRDDPNDLVQGNIPGNLLEVDSERVPGSMHLLEVVPGENVASTALSRGGYINAPNVFSETEGFGFAGGLDRNKLQNFILPELLDQTDEGGELEAFERKNIPNGVFGIIIVLDLGSRIGLNKIRFYPRNTVQPSPTTPFEDDYLRAFDLLVNDGLQLTDEGNPVWRELVSESDNPGPVVEIDIDPPQVLRHIRLQSKTSINWEIDELEIYGEGFFATGHYLSDIFDAGEPVAWTDLRWTEEIVGRPGDSSLEIRTRTGTDDSPFVFTRKLNGISDAEEIPFAINSTTVEMDLEGYENLPPTDDEGRQWERGNILDDLVNWSPFSSPYPESAANGPGTPVISPSPRRFFQFEATFHSTDLSATRILKTLSIDFATPPLADSVNAEIFPREVDVSRTIDFTYSVLAVIKSSGLTGFDTIEISTPARVAGIDAIELRNADDELLGGRQFTGLDDTSSVDGYQILKVADDGFSLRFPHVRDNHTRVVVRFKSQVLTYSTNFGGAVRLSTGEDAFQALTPGNTAFLGEGDDDDESGTAVVSPEVLTSSRLLDEVVVQPNPFSPNGDGVNDRLEVLYNLLAVTAPTPVSIKVHDLSGRTVAVIRDAEQVSGNYSDITWDGRGLSGSLLPPGLYLVRIEVLGDAEEGSLSRVVSLTY